MDFAHAAHKHKNMLSGNANSEVQSRMEKDLEYVHHKYEEEIKASWTPPTPDEEAIAYELACKPFEEYEQKVMNELIAQTNGILRYIKRDERID